MDDGEPPVLTAVSSSARQLYLLLRCIAFSPKAHVQIGEEGLKLSVDEASVMEASAFIDKSLFTTYNFHAPAPLPHAHPSPSSSDDEADPPDTTPPTFQISLPALLETLQIFGLTDVSASKPPWARDNPFPPSTAFSTVLGMNNLCRITYTAPGAPLSITLTEASIRTQCDLTTYEAAYADEIPFDRHSLAFKTIMRASWLYNAVGELDATAPEKLTLYAKSVKGKPFFALSAEGTLGSARVEFGNQPENKGVAYRRTPAPSAAGAGHETMDQPIPVAAANLLETFQLSDPHAVLKVSYKFSLVQKAARAMSVATKVSVRVDTQGVLSLQFMVEVEGGNASAGVGGAGKVSFVDFRFVPLVEDEADEGEDGEGGDDTVMGNGMDEDEDEDDGLV